jgi:hypothetical protein
MTKDRDDKDKGGSDSRDKDKRIREKRNAFSSFQTAGKRQ